MMTNDASLRDDYLVSTRDETRLSAILHTFFLLKFETRASMRICSIRYNNYYIHLRKNVSVFNLSTGSIVSFVGSLKLFFNQNFSNGVNLENWSEPNRTTVQIFGKYFHVDLDFTMQSMQRKHSGYYSGLWTRRFLVRVPSECQYSMRLDRLHRAYPSLHPFGVVHWVPVLSNIKTATGCESNRQLQLWTVFAGDGCE